MGSQNGELSDNPIDRYQTLRLKEFLSKPSHYLFACKELSFILKKAYAIFPKDLQSLIFQETLFAFRLLPEIRMQSAISAANSLLKSAEFALPKQKRALAVKEYKHAVVASKRKSKANHEEEGLGLLPQDILVHIFSFLDVQSLICASAVCRSWNAAASDNHLWKFLYTIFFCNSDIATHTKLKTRGVIKNEDVGYGVPIDWILTFKTAYKDTSYRKFISHRGYCLSCRSIVWLSSSKCSNRANMKDGSNHSIKPISTDQIVDYILDDLSSESSFSSSSDSDSDSEDGSIYKLWAYPRHTG